MSWSCSKPEQVLQEEKVHGLQPRSVILKVVGEDFEPFPGGLNTFLLVATRMRGCASGIEWVETRDQLPTIKHEGTPTTNKGSVSKCQ